MSKTSSSPRPNIGIDKNLLWVEANELAKYISDAYNCSPLKKTNDFNPLVGIICGSGLGNIAEIFDGDDEMAKQSKRLTMNYKDMPHMPVSYVEGHKNQLTIGSINGQYLSLCFQGRSHIYEGIDPYKVTLPIRVMKLLGVKTLFVTNSSGCLSKHLKPGDIMIIKDHIDFVGLAGNNPLVGLNDKRWGVAFPDMKGAYDPDLRNKAIQAGQRLKLTPYLKEGIYVMMGGPYYANEAEKLMFARFGGHAIGASTVPEVLVARQSMMKICGFSLITSPFCDPNDDYQNPDTAPKDPEQMLALSVDDGSRRIGQIIKEILTNTGPAPPIVGGNQKRKRDEK